MGNIPVEKNNSEMTVKISYRPASQTELLDERHGKDSAAGLSPGLDVA